MDVGKCAAGIAGAEGWQVVEWRASRDAARAGDEVSVVVAGGDLRGEAVLTVGRAARAGIGMAWDGVASSHLPRALPPPHDRRASRGGLTVRLREHPAGGTLVDVLAADRGLTAGEAVTVLVGIARGLSGLHGAGRGGVGLGPADVGLRGDGCPVLTGIDRLRELDQRTMAEDVAGFAELAGVLCSAVTNGRGTAVLAAATDRRHGSWEDVVAGLLRAADPTAVRPVRNGPAGVSHASARGDPAADDGRRGDRDGGRGVRGRDVLGILERALDLLGDRPVARGMAVVRGWIVARPRLVAVACSPLVAVTVLLMVVPGQDGPR